jgi:UDP-N-acetylmuramoyl-L-alanyl-D-glutamate--2,6-diaminopimelate ligase
MNVEFSKIYPVASHSDNVGQGSVFVAMKGKNTDGMFYIISAIERGATEIVVQDDMQIPDLVMQEIEDAKVKLTRVPDAKKALAWYAAEKNGYPAKKLKIFGITGTKGKTSTAYITYQLLKHTGYKAALLSTAEKLILDQKIDIDLTTPLPDHIHAFLRTCVENGVQVVVMEVSAQSLTLHRIETIEFDAAAFTNFSHEHLEFYPNLDIYFQEKCKIFKYVKNNGSIFVNCDDEYGKQICQEHPEYKRYSLIDQTAYMYGQTHVQNHRLVLDVVCQQQQYKIYTQLFGLFNGYNLLAAMSLVRSLDISFEKIAQAAQQIYSIPGRMEFYEFSNGAMCFIDYAHNPSSFEAVLSTMRQLTDHLIVVFGAGGARDKSKRPMMGAIVDKYADIAILTSDNPRNEDPVDIINDIAAGFDPSTDLTVIREVNRKVAIETAHQMSKKGSVIAILGKGRDEYQIIGKLTFPFQERLIIKSYME